MAQLGLLLALLAGAVYAGDCYDESYMPMPLATNNASGDIEYMAITGCPANGYFYMGGYTMSPDLLFNRVPPMPIYT